MALLNTSLADCIDLQMQAKQAHWNVKGPNFIALHKLFDEVNVAVSDYVDEIAERTVQLGGVAEVRYAWLANGVRCLNIP